MNRLISIHPTHMYVVASLPLIHQLDLEEQLHPARLQLDADIEYTLTLRKCYKGDDDAEILQKYEEAMARGHVVEDTYDVPAAMATLQQQKEPHEPQPTEPTRSSGRPLLPHELNDLWPRIFVHLTTRTHILSTELHLAREEKLREARVDCVTDFVINAEGQTLLGQETAVARALQGWEDLHMFMSSWILEWSFDIPPSQSFLNVARMMGLPGCLPPLLSASSFCEEAREEIAAAGYMVVQS